MAKIAISLPDALLEEIERERRVAGKSRSEFIRHALEALLCSDRAKIERYIEGYRRHPTTEEERAWVETTAKTAYAVSPWEDDSLR